MFRMRDQQESLWQSQFLVTPKHEVFVDRFQLVGQRVHAGDGEAEVGVELVGAAQGVGIQGHLQQFPIAIVGCVGIHGVEVCDVVLGKGDLSELPGVLAH